MSDPVEKGEQDELRERLVQAVEAAKPFLGEGRGIAFLFEFEGAGMAYVATAQPRDMISLVLDWLEAQPRGLVEVVQDRRRAARGEK